jgi:hypothetical protein
MSEEHVDPKAPADADASGHDASEAEADRVPTVPLVAWFLTIVIGTVITVVLAYSYFGKVLHEEVTAKYDVVDPALRSLHASEENKLAHYQWVDKKAGVVRIPLERAEELVLRDWSSRPTAPVAPTETQPASSAAPASSARGSHAAEAHDSHAAEAHEK